MLTRILQIALTLAIAAAVGWAQDAPVDQGREAAAPAEKAPGSGVDFPDLRKAARDKVKVLAPKDVPGELKRLKSKADIKAEITVNVSGAQPVTFKGVIRNGKLIEKLDKGAKRFLVEKEFTDQHCGVRLWWSGNSDGFIFFRYSTIKTLTLTGQLSAQERAEIMRRLKAHKEGKQPADGKTPEESAEEVFESLEKLPPVELKKVLLARYPYDKGWDHERFRQLKHKQLIENKVLTQEEAVYLRYFRVLQEARFDLLKRKSEKHEIEPGSADDTQPDERDRGPGVARG
jgi:hypothetical protein